MRAGTEGEVPVRIAGYVEPEPRHRARNRTLRLASMAVMSAWQVPGTVRQAMIVAKKADG
jgi:hypothetical protein